jgi:putative phosphoesterase
MKVGVISDTHVPVAAPSLPTAIFEIFKGVDLILHAGDIVNQSVLDELSVIAPVEAVAGNMDGNELHLRLSARKVLTLGRFSVGLTHGKYRIDMQKEMIRKEFSDVDLIVFGHSHMPVWERAFGVWFLNPGSPTDKRYAPYNSVALLTVGDTLSAEIVRL